MRTPLFDRPVMSTLLPAFLAVPIGLMIFFETDLPKYFTSLTEPDDEDKVHAVGRAILYLRLITTSWVERSIENAMPIESEASKMERKEVSKVFASKKALRNWGLERAATQKQDSPDSPVGETTMQAVPEEPGRQAVPSEWPAAGTGDWPEMPTNAWTTSLEVTRTLERIKTLMAEIQKQA